MKPRRKYAHKIPAKLFACCWLFTVVLISLDEKGERSDLLRLTEFEFFNIVILSFKGIDIFFWRLNLRWGIFVWEISDLSPDEFETFLLLLTKGGDANGGRGLLVKLRREAYDTNDSNFEAALAWILLKSDEQ